MKVHVQLFLCIIVATCQASLLPVNRQRAARQGAVINPLNEKIKGQSILLIDTNEEPDPKTLLVPNVYKLGRLRSNVDPNEKYAAYHLNNNPKLSSKKGNIVSRSVQLHQSPVGNQEAQRLQLAKASREAELAEIDREALSKLSEADRLVLTTRFSQDERKALLAKLDEAEIPLKEAIHADSRFSISAGGFSSVAAQLGAGAGRYIGGKLAGAIGANLGAAAGAYLGAAAASRFDLMGNKKVAKISSNIQSNAGRGMNYGGGYAAVTAQTW